MTSARARTNLHSTPPRTALKLAGVVLCAAVVHGAALGAGQSNPPAGDSGLRAELTELLRAGRAEEAVRQAQAALDQRPQDADVRAEFVSLHLALARDWLGREHFDAAESALQAILAVQPDHAAARTLLDQINSARQQAEADLAEADRLLRFELYEAALRPLRTLKALRPDLADAAARREAAARLGTADDHYLARNFHEAFALYESVLAEDPDAPADIHSRWAISLALALAESDFGEPLDEHTAGRLLARAIDVLRRTREPIVGEVIGGLLAERAGRLLEAGRSYADAVGRVWTLPAADRRRTAVAALRTEAIEAVRRLYGETPTGRRAGFWAIALPGVWKTRETPHAVVHARNDRIAERVAEAVEFHLAELADWLAFDLADTWDPKLELRIHATREELAETPGTSDITFAVSHTRVQGDRILLRRLEVFQADPWLLSGTLPHELTHVLVTEWTRSDVLPLALDEGLAMQAEPPARRLMYRRRLAPRPPEPDTLLAMSALPDDRETFYAGAATLVDWLLHLASSQTLANPEGSAGAPAEAPAERGAAAATSAAEAGSARDSAAAEVQPPPHWLVEHFRGGAPPEWWRLVGFENTGAMQLDWRDWYAARREPYRMPLMLLVEPSPEHRRDRPPATEPARGAGVSPAGDSPAIPGREGPPRP